MIVRKWIFVALNSISKGHQGKQEYTYSVKIGIHLYDMEIFI